MNEINEVEIISLTNIIRLVNKYKIIIIIITIITTLLGAGVSKYVIRPKYVSSADVLVTSKAAFNSTTLVKTIAEFMSKQIVIENAVDEFDLEVEAGDIKEGLDVSLNSNFITLSYTANDPKITDDVVNAIIDSAVDIVNEEEGFAAIKDSFARVSYAKEGEKTSSNFILYTILGSFIGLAISGVIILFKEVFDDKYKGKDELESSLEIAVIGVIPEYKIKS